MGGRAKRRCAYCSRDATTQDHVLARCFLENPTRATCQLCRVASSATGSSKWDEEYFRAIMAQSAWRSSATLRSMPAGEPQGAAWVRYPAFTSTCSRWSGSAARPLTSHTMS